ncbi:hypothetical protein ACO0SA_003508 [Hanseniaspora valbyensis]
MENKSLFSHKQLGKLELLIDKYKRQWKDIKNNTNVVDKSSRIKLHWNDLIYNDTKQQQQKHYPNIVLDAKDKSNLRYFLAFTRNLRYKTSFNDIRSFENIIDLITYFLLINPQILSQDIALFEDNKTHLTFDTLLIDPSSNESIWYLIQISIDTFKSQFNVISDIEKKYSNFFKLIDTLTLNWLQIGVDIYGVSLEKKLNSVFHKSIMNTYSKLMDYINLAEASNEDAANLEGYEFSIENFINDLIEEAIYLHIILNNYNIGPDDNIIRQHFRIVFYLFDGLTDYLSVYDENAEENFFESDESYLTNVKKLWFLLGYFVNLLEKYVFPKENTHFEIDTLMFGLDFINTN